MKRPAFQFYPADWRKDLELQSCSIGARGLWIELCTLMHEAEPYGHLTLNAEPMPDEKAARACRVEFREYRKLLAEIEAAGVSSRTATGILFSRRMVRDEQTRNARATGGIKGGEFGEAGKEYGAKGGRPRKETGDKEPPFDNSEGVNKPPLKPPPSSAVASASSSLPPAVATRGSTAGAGDSQNGGEKKHLNGKGKSRESWHTIQWATDTAKTFAMARIQGESDDGFIDRVITAAKARRMEGARDAKRRDSH